ncbi:UDP-N-acetylmuramoyl-tripeptide--D-alanyl-D-alanine ligase [Belnapia sp. T6]|uniref:UDP-N-acetylmuramoyl-tripeptide--D-alanyl-D-alanine ligase n=1 Tax=Belnapia mucosa TaxID=2804532 RepID=A0ABS1V366_9PROT|nr:UDP-N-acetylmuramoyl-tripeptide--D-alanyl-D-alanine ligase [Belnapia mucosa]MBL6456130.1 UDP-N-acetylmuramoyl-tripeptide--D-alanyl-D-alanine ligase [Belnapia mucosa]
MSLWTAAALRAATGGSLAAELAVTGVSIDSRAVQPGDLFIALRDARDGHDFVADALARGAAAAMVDRDPPGVTPEAPLLRVGDTLAGLTALGAAGRARTAARIVAVTGSVGKTGTKEMLRLLLSGLGPTHAAVASYNNHWGVPLTLARMPEASAYAVIEIGMNNPGEIAPLARLARPHAALVTNIGAAHIGHLGSLEAIAAEKATIAAGLEPGGIAVLPAEDPFLPLLRAAAPGHPVVTFGEGGDVRALSVTAEATGSAVTAEIAGRRAAFRLGAPGAHLVRNAIGALAAVHALGGDAAAVAPRLAEYRPMVGRGAAETIATPDGGRATLVDEAFNGQPPSVRAALAVLALLPARRRVAVLGQMGELGPFSAEEHAALAPHVQAAADAVFLCGPDMRHLAAALPPGMVLARTETSGELAPLVAAGLRDGDAVLVKGSKATLMGKVLAALRGIRA